MKYSNGTLLLFLLNIFSLFSAETAFSQSVKITGEVSKPFDVSIEALKDFDKTVVVRKEKDGRDRNYTGVLLSALLVKAGASLGAELRGKNLTKYVFAEASDGYQVVFPLVELDPEFAERKVILAYQVDGKALGPAEGPFKIIIEREKKPARCVRQLTSLKIVSAK